MDGQTDRQTDRQTDKSIRVGLGNLRFLQVIMVLLYCIGVVGSIIFDFGYKMTLSHTTLHMLCYKAERPISTNSYVAFPKPRNHLLSAEDHQKHRGIRTENRGMVTIMLTINNEQRNNNNI